MTSPTTALARLRALVVAIDEGPASLVIQCKHEARAALSAIAKLGGE